MLQQSILRKIGCVGTGLHTGEVVRMTLHPAPADHGIVFDCGGVLIPAHVDYVTASDFGMVLSRDGASVSTVEHLMAALSACGVDNVRIEMHGSEVPIMDGSASPFVNLIHMADTVQQARERRYIQVTRPLTVKGPDRSVRLEPFNGRAFGCSIEFDHPLIKIQSRAMSLSEASFVRDIASARTFAFASWIKGLRERGLARGGSLHNAVVFDDTMAMNPGGLRFRDECVRHKLIDAVGDLYLAGAPILGRYIGERAGHGLHAELVQAMMQQRSHWRWVTWDADRQSWVTAVENDEDADVAMSSMRRAMI